MSNAKPPDAKVLALIAGPTASGKSDMAVALAQALASRRKNAVVINADSAQVYADLRVLSARPTPEEMRGIDHRLFGTWDGAQACSAADWAAAAKREIEIVQAEGAVPILVGGTGLYIRTLLDGIAPVPEIDPQIREGVRTLTVADSYAALLEEDPERAAKLAPGDAQRIGRALEVVRSTGRTLGQWQEENSGGIASDVTLAPLVLMPDRAELYERCDARFARMMEKGAMAEVSALLERGLHADLPVMRAIGVTEIAALLRGELGRDEAIALGQTATRKYAKRQFTWLRHQPPAEWPRLRPEYVDIAQIFEILFRE